MRHKARTRRLREKVIYYIGGSLIRRANKRQKRIGRRARESYARTARTQMPITNLRTALSQIRSFNVNRKKRQVKSLFHIKNLARSQVRVGRRNLTVTL